MVFNTPADYVYPDFGHTFSNQIALTFDHVAGFGRRQKTDRIEVKPKSADDYVGRSNNLC